MIVILFVQAFTRHAAEREAQVIARVAELEAALRAIVEGNVPRPVGYVWRKDGTPSKHDQCTHDVWMWEDCGNCISDFARAALDR